MITLGWQVIIYKKTQISIKKLPLVPWCVGKILRSHTHFTSNDLDLLRKRYHLIVLSYEPFSVTGNTKGRMYFEVLPRSLQLTPTKTLHIDLTSTETVLHAQLKAKTRYNLKRAKVRLGSQIIPGNIINPDCFTEIVSVWKKNHPYSLLFPAPIHEFSNLIHCFKENCFIVRAYETYNPHATLAFCLILFSDNMAFYWHNGSTPLGRQLFGPTLCVWEALIESKRRKRTVFDFEGLYDERFSNKNVSWKGFSHFKEGFLKI